MVDVPSTGIGRASDVIADNAGKGNKGDKFRVFNNEDTGVTTFEEFFVAKKAEFTANMGQAAENQSNGKGHRPEQLRDAVVKAACRQ